VERRRVGVADLLTGLAAPTGSHRGGRGDPLVLLHGIGGVWTAWEPVLDALEREHDVFALTLPGHFGADPMPVADPPTVTALADAVEQRLQDEGIERPHIAGNSLGGWIALELGRRGLARSIVGLSPAGAWPNVRELQVAIKAAAVGNALMARVDGQLDGLLRRPGSRRLVMRGIVAHGERMTPAAAKENLRASAHAPIMAALMASMVEQPFNRLERLLDIPVRLAWGSEDRLLPAKRFAQPLLDRVPGAEYLILPGVGHVPMSDDPELVARTILEVTRG
jgi:pimeloyl-ACP methyl ester carboxylesterase